MKNRVVGLPIRIEEATNVLIKVYGDNLLTEKEYERRLRIVQQAENLDDIDSAIWDLPENYTEGLTKFDHFNPNENLSLEHLGTYLNKLVKFELEDDEFIRWHGQISKKRAFTSKLPIFFFGIIFFSFAVFWVAMAYTGVKDDTQIGAKLFPLFGTPFILIGFWMLMNPFLSFLSASKSLYLITNKRAINFKKTFLGNKTESFYSKDFTQIKTNNNGNNYGDLIFSEKTYETKDGTNSMPIGFLGINNLKEAKEVIVDLM